MHGSNTCLRNLGRLADGARPFLFRGDGLRLKDASGGEFVCLLLLNPVLRIAFCAKAVHRSKVTGRGYLDSVVASHPFRTIL